VARIADITTLFFKDFGRTFHIFTGHRQNPSMALTPVENHCSTQLQTSN